MSHSGVPLYISPPPKLSSSLRSFHSPLFPPLKKRGGDVEIRGTKFFGVGWGESWGPTGKSKEAGGVWHGSDHHFFLSSLHMRRDSSLFFLLFPLQVHTLSAILPTYNTHAPWGGVPSSSSSSSSSFHAQHKGLPSRPPSPASSPPPPQSSMGVRPVRNFALGLSVFETPN